MQCRVPSLRPHARSPRQVQHPPHSSALAWSWPWLLASSACVARGAAAEELAELAPADAALALADAALAARPARTLDGEGVFYVLGADPAHPEVRYLDGQLARNQSCVIQLGNKLSRRIPPVYVNGQPIGFC